MERLLDSFDGWAATAGRDGDVDRPERFEPTLGLPVLRPRKSTFIHGIEDDARAVVDHLAGYLAGARSP